ncbi:MHC class I alpha chain [Labeo rohita]|uniref:MHC class I alpha chain n=1 Tax=Labeo rohita TaxID=84645 RepID=A0A498MYQ4_LABRO|nr:MHC class I alpha chain [Labeo rohita]
MKTCLLLLIGIQLVYAGKHSLQYIHFSVFGGTDFPEFTAVGRFDDEQFDYFDSNIMKDVPKTEWIRQNVGADYWDMHKERRIVWVHRIRNDIQILKDRFNQSESTGVYTYQIMYGCEWDDQTGETNAFEQHGYDGEDFISLDLKELRFISPVQQGIPTVQKWNNDKSKLDYVKNYYSTECIDWLKKYVQYGKSSLEKTVSPQVSLLQKDPSSPVACHATGFYPGGVTINWQKNGQDHDEDVDLGEIVPSENGTFQVMSKLNVKPEEWKKNEYECVVEHKSRTTRSVLTEDNVITNYGSNSSESLPIIPIIIGAVAAVLLVVIGVAGYCVYQKRNGD